MKYQALEPYAYPSLKYYVYVKHNYNFIFRVFAP